MSDQRDKHPAVVAQGHLARIATTFPDLVYGLGRNGNSAGERVSGSRERPLPIRENVSEALSAVHEFAMYLADRVYWETCDSLAELLDDDIIATVSRRYIGVFAPEDDGEARAFAADCKHLANRVDAVAYPSGVREIDVPNRADERAARRDPMPCAEPGCEGHYRMRVKPDGAWFITAVDPATWPPLTCSADQRHIVTGVELSRAMAFARSTGRTFRDELVRDRAA